MTARKYAGNIGGFSEVSTASLTRASGTTQYASGDLIANSGTAGSVTPLTFSNVARHSGGSFMIRRVRMTKSDDDVTTASFRLHLFSINPVGTAPAGGDNAAISLNTAISGYLGSVDLDMTASPDIYNTAGNLAIGVPTQGSEIIHRTASGTAIYGLLEARGTYTPASNEVFTVYLEVIQD